MSFSNYAALSTSIAGFLNRQNLAAQIPDFIRLFEAKAERKLRTWQMVSRMYAKTIVSAVDGSNQEYLPLPADYLQLKRARVTDAPCAQDPLEYASPDYIDTLQRDNVTGGVPTAYSIVGQALRLGPIPDKQYTIEIMYYAKIPKLSSNVPTSWLLADHPDLYLYGALLNASPYMKDDERIPIWQGIVEGEDGNGGIFEDIRIANERAEQSGSIVRARLRGAYGSRGSGIGFGGYG